MEVLLKRSKITTAILNQSIKFETIHLIEGKILGWCMVRDIKYLVCYYESDGIISKHVNFKSATYKNEYGSHL